MFLEDIRIVKTSPCLAEENLLRIEAVLASSIIELLPYINSVLPNPNYDPEKHMITFKKGEKLFFLTESQVSITKLVNMTDAYGETDWLKDLINDIYNRKKDIIPIHERRSRPGPIAIYKLLPKTNCKKCGELTCLAFATRLNAQETDLKLCIDLFTDKYSEEKDKMLELLGD